MIVNYFKRLLLKKEIRRISTAIGSTYHCNWLNFRRNKKVKLLKTRTEAERRLFCYILSTLDLKYICNKHDASIDTIKKLYEQLVHTGAKHNFSGIYVPVIALTNKTSLDYLLQYFKDKEMPIFTDDALMRVQNVFEFIKYGDALPEP